MSKTALCWNGRAPGAPAWVFLLLLSATATAAAALRPHLQAPQRLECDGRAALPLVIEDSRPQLSWRLASSDMALRGVRQSAYRVLVASSRQAIEHGRGDLWDSGIVQSRFTTGIAYAGRPVPSQTQVFWKVKVWDEQSAPSAWSGIASWTAALAGSDWTAHWIAAADSSERQGANEPMPIFRRDFDLRKPVQRALLSISGLGQDEVHLNGRVVNPDVLAPGWSQYNRTIFYDTYDVTAMLRLGANAIGVMLGNGMYNVQQTPGRYTKFTGSYGVPKLIAQLRVEFRDGTVTVIATDARWKSAPGPVTFSSTYGGEDYDARREPRGWDMPGFGDADWKNAALVGSPGGTLTPEIAPAVMKMRTYTPIKRTVIGPGLVVYDLGQNYAGWPELEVRGRRGARVKMTPGELLKADGTVSQRSSGRGNWFEYTLRGDPSPLTEHWHPRFSYYGFRYVQVETFPAPGAVERPSVLSLVGDAVHSSRAGTGEWRSSSAMLNSIHALIVHAMENNTVSLLTDCPHREKLGWLEQTQLMASPLLYDADLRGVYAAMERDMEDTQRADGFVPTIAPQYTVFPQPWDVFNDSPEWGSAAVLDPWIVYQRSGDLASLAAYYPMMQRYADYLASRAQGGIVAYGLGDWYDVGPGPPGFSKLTTLGVTATATYYEDLRALEGAAHVLGKNDDARRYESEAGHVKAAFNARFYHPQTKLYDRGSQTANAMPLALGIAPPSDRDAVLGRLIDDIRAHHEHTTSGEVGWHYEVEALMNAGRGDVLREMMLRTGPPSYGAQLAAGATSLTEAWNANPAASQDHFMLGYGEQWFYAGLGGIRIHFADAAESNVLEIRPEFTPGIDWVKTSYASVFGVIRTYWRRQGERMLLDVTIPPNTLARVELPAPAGSSVFESGREATRAPGVSLVRQDGPSRVFEVGSGIYHFAIQP